MFFNNYFYEIIYKILARTFADLSVIPIPLNGNFPLKYYVSLAASDILAVGSGKESQSVLRVILLNNNFNKDFSALNGMQLIVTKF